MPPETDDRAWRPPSPDGGIPARPTRVEQETLEGYTDLVEVARGGDSVVYRARQVRLDRDVAIKVLLVDDDAALRRFERELEITLRLGREHPNIVTVLDTGTAGSGRPCLVMDFFEQGSLQDRLKAQGPATLSEAVAVGTVLADALAFAHERGVLHRDVKPQNVLLLPTSYVLTDFGVARLTDSEHTSSADRFSYRHASPQMLDGRTPTAADDVWSLGSTLFTLLEGRPPFASDEPGEDTALAYLRRVRTEEPRAFTRDDVPAQLVAAIERCLDKDPNTRWGSAGELRDALAAVPTEARSWDPDREAPAAEPETPFAVVVKDAPVSPESVWAPPKGDALPPRRTTKPQPVARETETGSGPPTEPAPAVSPAEPVSATAADNGPIHAASALAHHAPVNAVSGADVEPTGFVQRGDLEASADQEVEPERRVRIGLLIAAALLLGVTIGGVKYLVSGNDKEPVTTTPTPTAPAVVPMQTATSVPSPTGPVVTDPKLSPTIDDLRSRGTSIVMHWTDPSGGKATFVVARSDTAGGSWTGRVEGKGTGVTLQTWGPPVSRPCFVVVAVTGDQRGVSEPRCLTMTGPSGVSPG